MDLTYPPEAETFRKEVRAWLSANLPPGWGEPGFEMTPDERDRFQAAWARKLYDGGWIAATWPAEYGGRGLTTMQSVVLFEEFTRVRAPMRADFFGDTLVGPTLLQWGTEDQKREFLPRILRGEIRWCQGFSEPDAGSDLASLRTSAVLDGDEWVITGQKTWTSHAQYADYCFVLARTDPVAPKHRGISFILVPMHQPQITVRAIEQIDGSQEFNEVFFDGARAPARWVVGGVNNGWRVAMTTLGFERGSSATTGYRRFQKEIEELIDLAQRTGRSTDPLVRQRLAAAWSKVQIMRVNGLRSLTDVLHGTKQAQALGPLNKLFWSEYHQEATKLAVDLAGMDGEILTGSDEEYVPGVGRRRNRAGYPVSPRQASFLFSRSETIWGGSSQVQRNIVGERVLGLPKEPG
jgi:alkylation response protein AidB-like acyl-CoA dehydrogenase